MGAAAIPIAIASTVLSAGVSAYGYYQQGQQAAQQARYQQAVATINAQTSRRNAELASRNAAVAEEAGGRAAEDRARQIRQVIGAQRARAGAGGLMVEEGTSVADLIDDTAELGGMAITEIRNNAARQAYGYRVQQQNFEREAETGLLRASAYGDAAGAASSAGMISAGASLLGGAASAFGRWSDYQRTGVVQRAPQVEAG